MLDRLAIPAEWLPLFIFLLRVLDMSFAPLRVLSVVRGRRAPAVLTGFIQSALWVVAVTSVLSHLENLFNLVAYAGGFATGTVVGLVIEERLAIGHGHLRIIRSHRRGGGA